MRIAASVDLFKIARHFWPIAIACGAFFAIHGAWKRISKLTLTTYQRVQYDSVIFYSIAHLFADAFSLGVFQCDALKNVTVEMNLNFASQLMRKRCLARSLYC